MDRYGNRWKDNTVELYKLKICYTVYYDYRKPVLVAIVMPSEALSRFC